jgi:hypothetical protein
MQLEDQGKRRFDHLKITYACNNLAMIFPPPATHPDRLEGATGIISSQLQKTGRADV